MQSTAMRMIQTTGKGRVHPMTMLPLKIMYIRRTWADFFFYMKLGADAGFINIKISLRLILINAQCNKSSY